MTATPVSTGTPSINSGVNVITANSPRIGRLAAEGGESPALLNLPPVYYNSIYRVRVRKCPRKLSVSARGREAARGEVISS